MNWRDHTERQMEAAALHALVTASFDKAAAEKTIDQLTIADLAPLRASLRMLIRKVDGPRCTHCGKPNPTPDHDLECSAL